ncbi:MAG: hypothetical protein SFU98_05905 [Leptospiraceae bacterium]|nr:hypothetical protein [Leptospiraceae bacterium]
MQNILTHNLSKLKLLSNSNLKKLNLISTIRLISFLAFVSFCILAYIYPKGINFIFLGISLTVFGWFVREYTRLSHFQERLLSLQTVFEREKNRADMNMEVLYRGNPIQVESLSKNHYHNDLDIFGKNGLYFYLDTTFTLGGQEAFFSELTRENSPTKESIFQRQKEISELGKRRKITYKIFRYLNEISLSGGYAKINWKKFPSGSLEFFQSYPFLPYLFRVWIVFAWIYFLVSFLLELPSFFALFVLFNLAITAIGFKKKNLILQKYKEVFEKFSQLESLFVYLHKTKFKEESLSEFFPKKNLSKTKFLFKNLNRIVDKLSFTSSPLLRFILNFFFLFDLWILSEIKIFEEKFGKEPENLFRNLEYLDSILPFANFLIHNEKNSFPIFNPKLGSIEAKNISHPLIPKEKRISNDLEKTLFGETVLITGSNMSGKTTYLRTIGVNVVLALAGSSVCAESLQLPVLKILTSIRNEDSMLEGISFFYAEVKRIANILEKSNIPNEPSLILIDEVLKGTNTRERLIASRAIMNQIAKTKSISFITTHDLELAKRGKKLKLKNFSEIVKSGKIDFDYKIRNGVVKSTNALKILSSEIPTLRF